MPLTSKARASGARENHSRPDTMDMSMAVPYILVPLNDLHGIVREAEAAERRRAEEKVGTWRKEINSAYHVILLAELRYCTV